MRHKHLESNIYVSYRGLFLYSIYLFQWQFFLLASSMKRPLFIVFLVIIEVVFFPVDARLQRHIDARLRHGVCNPVLDFSVEVMAFRQR